MKHFDNFGVMIDVSRNAVMSVDGLKKFLPLLKKMGYNSVMLYTEDTYEVEGHPYFGYMRGRYSLDEIREIDRFAEELGMELIPCIQTLAHLKQSFKWGTVPMDHHDVLLCDDKETYKLIDDMFKTVKKTFSSRLIHIGMDEAWNMGRGKYLKKYGLEPGDKLFCDHLAKVRELANKYNFKPMIWSDMIIRFGGSRRVYDPNTVITPELCELVPKNCELVFWDYYNPGESFYTKNIQNHRALGAHTIFAGGIWTWSGHCPYFSESIANTRPALDACKKTKTRNVFFTLWGDNGGECSRFAILPSLKFVGDSNL